MSFQKRPPSPEATDEGRPGRGSGGPAGADGGDWGTDAGLVVLTLIWGINFSVIKVGLLELEPLAFNALRFPLAALALGLMLRLRSGPRPSIRRRDWPRLVGLGILGNVVYQPFFIFGLNRTLAGNAAILLATTPVWITLLSALLGHERPRLGTWLGVSATLAGMGLVVTGGPREVSLGGDTLGGDLLMIGASLVWSLYTVGGRGLTRRYGSLRVTAWTIWVGTPFLVLMGAPSLVREPPTGLSAGAWGGIVYAGVLAIGVAYFLWYYGVRRLGSSRTAVYSNLVPVVALVTAWLWLGERPGPLQLVGAAVVIGGLTVARLSRPSSTPGTPEPAPE